MHFQLGDIPGSRTLEGGEQIFLSKKPGLFATWAYPVGVLLLLITSQYIALWLVLVAGLLAHGVRYPRTYDVFYPVHFYITAALVLFLPSFYLFLTSATHVQVGS